MKTIIFFIALLLCFVAAQVSAQSSTYLTFDSVGVISSPGDTTKLTYALWNSTDSDDSFGRAYIGDTLVFFYSAWRPSYSFSFVFNSNLQFYVTSHQLDSTNGRVKFVIPALYLGSIYTGIDPSGEYISISEKLVTSITSAIQQNKTGTVTIYDSQGRFVKTSHPSNYTEGLNPGQLYIYNTVYSDNTVDKGKFMIE